MLRTEEGDEGLRNAVAGFWQGRSDRYSELRGQPDANKLRLEMFQMGG